MKITSTTIYTSFYVLFLFALFGIATYNKTHQLSTVPIDTSLSCEKPQTVQTDAQSPEPHNRLANQTWSHQTITSHKFTHPNHQWLVAPSGWLNTPDNRVALGYLIVEVESTMMKHQAIIDLSLDLNTQILGIFTPLNWLQLEANFSSQAELDALLTTWQAHPAIKSVTADSKITSVP